MIVRLIYFIALLMIANIIFNWKLAQWKVQEIQKATNHIEAKIDGTLETLEQIRIEMKDDPKWKQALQSINSNQ